MKRMPMLITLPFLLIAALLVPSMNSANAAPTGTVLVAQMPKAHLPQGQNGGTDDYRCFLIDPKVTQDSLITQVEFQPQQRKMMHHAIMFLVGAKDLAEAK